MVERMKLSDGNALFLPLPLRSVSFRVAIPSTCRLVAIIVDDRRVPRKPGASRRESRFTHAGKQGKIGVQRPGKKLGLEGINRENRGNK